MKFHELAVGEKFKFNNQEYVKIPEIKLSCCKIKENAQVVANSAKAVIKPMEEVEKVVTQ
jgi:hypothetical protein